MSTILVVDDCSVDRLLAGGLLEREDGFAVHYADSARETLDRLERNPPDLIITDIQMPDMDGLELVKQVRQRYPLVPVILMTSRGSEETAVKALRAGAANYVPKGLLRDELCDTVRTVLAASSGARHMARLMAACLCASRYEFRIENDSALITPLVAHLQQAVEHLGLCDQAERVRLGIALEEALVNAMYHGNLGLSSDVREGSREVYRRLVEERRTAPPYKDRRVHVIAELSRQEGVFVIRDEGEGFDPAAVADPCEADLEKVTGRGLLLMRTFMDDVKHNSRGNEVTLVKRRGNRACAA
ncbi:MAG: response regulator [Planctomycetia bacterium]|nr:response regulator [Planctomycetia bacterium]